jgi:hypothetical protein
MSSLCYCVVFLTTLSLVRGFLFEGTTAATAAASWQSVIKQKVNVLEYKMTDVESNMATLRAHDNTLGTELIRVNSVINNMSELSGITTHTNTHTHTHTHTHTRTHTHAHLHALTYVRSYAHACTHAHMHALMHARTHECTHAHTHLRTHARTHERTHARMHAHIQACKHKYVYMYG